MSRTKHKSGVDGVDGRVAEDRRAAAQVVGGTAQNPVSTDELKGRIVEDVQVLGNTTVSTTANAIEEVKLASTVLPAEYGHSAGGLLSATYKAAAPMLALYSR